MCFGDSEEDKEERRRAKEAFKDIETRQAFIRKVFCILGTQLTITLGTILVVTTNEDAKTWMLENYLLVTAFSIIGSISYCGLVCCCSHPPMNYVMLIIFTVVESFTFCLIACAYRTDVILMAIGTTAIVIYVLSVFAIQTKIDFTTSSGLFMVVFIILVLLSIVCVFFPSKTLMFLISSFGVIVFSFALIINIQLIVVGENPSRVFAPDEYITAAAMLYIDIMMMFGYILNLFGLITDD